MKTKIKKYQFAGSNPCGEGTKWDSKSKKCIPLSPEDYMWNTDFGISKPSGVDSTLFPVNTNTEAAKNIPTNASVDPTTGKVIPGTIRPIMRDESGNIVQTTAPRKDASGKLIPYEQSVADALDQGFTLDSDGVYRKKEITKDPYNLEFSKPFKALNTLMDITQFFAGNINDAKVKREEREKIKKASYPTSSYNSYETGVNNVPVYVKTGGNVSAKKARQILHDKKVHGKPLTDQQRKYFGAIASGYIKKTGGWLDQYAEGGEFPNYKFPSQAYKEPFLSPYAYSFSPEANVNIYGLGLEAQKNIGNKFNVHGGINTNSVIYPGGSKIFTKPTYNLGVSYRFKDGGDNGEPFLPNPRDIARQMVNKTDVPITIQEKQKQEAIANEITKRNLATNKRQFLSQGKASTPDSEARRKRLNQQYASQQPNAQIDEQGNVSRVNPNRSVTGAAENFMSRREDKAAEHAINALDAAVYVMGAGELADMAYNTIKNKLTTSAEKEIVKTISKNLEDLNAAKEFANKYGYQLPENLERISQSNELTDRTIRGLMDRHNTFVRGVSTNWEEISKRNPEILRHLEGKGIDWQNNPKAAAEYMSTHIPINTGYGRASLNQNVFEKGLEGLYTSNSIPTAEGYTYGQGYITKVKKPTDFSSLNRQDWINLNQPSYYEHDLPGENTFKINNEVVTPLNSGLELGTLYRVKDYKNISEFKNKVLLDLENQAELMKDRIQKISPDRSGFLKTSQDSYNNIINKINKIKNQNWEEADINFDKNILKTEHYNADKSFGESYGDFGYVAEDIANKLSASSDDAATHSKNLIDIVKDVAKKNNEKISTLLDKVDKLSNKNNLSTFEKNKIRNLKEQITNLRWDSKNKVSIAQKQYLNENFPGWELLKDRYAHYIHLGTPGEKVLEAIKSFEITPEIWKNKSRSHTNRYTKGLSAMNVGGQTNWLNKYK